LSSPRARSMPGPWWRTMPTSLTTEKAF